MAWAIPRCAWRACSRASSLALRAPYTARAPNPWFASASVRSIHIPRELSYNPDLGVDPLFSSTHLQRHRELYHDQACENLNNIINGKPYEALPIRDILRRTVSVRDEVHIFNAAAEVYNHDFFFSSIKPGGSPLEGNQMLRQMIRIEFESVEGFHRLFKHHAMAMFGSGFTWLVSRDGILEIMNTFNAATPAALDASVEPLLCIDMWEHAFFDEYLNDKGKYLDNFFQAIDWDIVSERYREHLDELDMLGETQIIARKHHVLEVAEAEDPELVPGVEELQRQLDEEDRALEEQEHDEEEIAESMRDIKMMEEFDDDEHIESDFLSREQEERMMQDDPDMLAKLDKLLHGTPEEGELARSIIASYAQGSDEEDGIDWDRIEAEAEAGKRDEVDETHESDPLSDEDTARA